MIPHPQEKTPPKIPGDVIGKERRLNDRIARNSQWLMQGVNQEAPKSEKHKTHDNTKLWSPGPKECKQPNLHEPDTVSIANPFFFHI